MRSIFASTIGGAAGVAAAFAGLGIYSLVIQLLVGDFTATAVLWRATEWRPGRRLSRKSFRELSTFGTPIIAATLLAFVSRRLDTVIVGGALGLALLGVYSMAQRVYQIALQIINKSTVDVTFSALSRLGESEDRRRQAFYKVIELTAVLCFPTYVGLAVIAEPLTLTLFGAKWLDSAPALVFFGLSGIPFSLTMIHLAAIKSAARTRYLFIINLVQLIVYLPVMILLVDGGPGYAAAASLISCAAIVPLEIAYVRIAFGLRVGDYLKSLVGASIATLVMAGATLAVSAPTTAWPPIARLVLVCGVGAAVYVLALRTLAPAAFNRCRELAIATLRRTS